MNQLKWLDWRVKALNEMDLEDKGNIFSCPKCGKPLKNTGSRYQCSCGWKEREPEWESKPIEEHHNAKYPSALLNLTVSQLLSILETENKELYSKLEQIFDRISPEVWLSESLNESFYHLTSEAKIGFMIREMKKNLSYIEKKFAGDNELSEVDDRKVDSWVKAYNSLKSLSERVNTLLKSMRGK